jgi:hypothetical protein
MARAAVIGAVWLCACGSSVPPPLIQSVSPAQAPTNVPTAITVRLEPTFPMTFDYGKRTVALDTRVTLRLGDQVLMVDTVEPQQLTAVVPAGLPAGAQEVRVTLADGREGVLSQGFTVLGAPEAAFTFDPIPEQLVGEPFTVTIRASGPDARRFEDTVRLESGKGRLLPRTSGRFNAGVRTEQLTLDQPGLNWVTATDAAGNQGSSEPFHVRNKPQVMMP